MRTTHHNQPERHGLLKAVLSRLFHDPLSTPEDPAPEKVPEETLRSIGKIYEAVGRVHAYEEMKHSPHPQACPKCGTVMESIVVDDMEVMGCPHRHEESHKSGPIPRVQATPPEKRAPIPMRALMSIPLKEDHSGPLAQAALALSISGSVESDLRKKAMERSAKQQRIDRFYAMRARDRAVNLARFLQQKQPVSQPLPQVKEIERTIISEIETLPSTTRVDDVIHATVEAALHPHHEQMPEQEMPGWAKNPTKVAQDEDFLLCDTQREHPAQMRERIEAREIRRRVDLHFGYNSTV